MTAIEYVRGIAEVHRDDAVLLYDEAFGPKFAVAVPDVAARRDLLRDAFRLDFAVGAVRKGELVGLAGFQTDHGSLTDGVGYRGLISRLGLLRGNRAALIFSLYDRKPQPGEIVMEGIAVRGDVRGQGMGSGLLDELAAYAVEEGFQTIRLDVIDTNPDARRLYERNGFVAVRTEHFAYLRWLLGFGASTTMVRRLYRSAENVH